MNHGFSCADHDCSLMGERIGRLDVWIGDFFVCHRGESGRAAAVLASQSSGVDAMGRRILEEPPGVVARYELNALIVDREVSFAALDRSDLLYTAAPARPVQNGCGLTDGVRFDQSGVPYSSGFDLSCGMAIALYWYESEVDWVAQEHLGSGLARIDHLVSYACRNIKGATAGR